MPEKRNKDRCIFYPTDLSEAVCDAGSDIAGKFICTREFSNTCEYKQNHANLRRKEK